MESPSVPAHRRLVPWQELLLAGSLLIFWSPPITQQLTVVSINATVGEDVLFHAHNLPGDLVGYNWFKGESTENENRSIASYVIGNESTITGPAGSGRETIYPNGSLLFQKVTQEDTGYYTLQVIKRNLRSERGTGQLRVYQPVGKPSIRARNSTVTEHKDTVVLTCLTNDTGISIRWLFNKQSLWLTDRMKLSQGNSILTIDPVRREDGGSYQCEVSNPVSSCKSDPLWLDVQYVSASQHPGLSDGAIAGIVIGVLAGIALIAALVYFLYIRKTGGSGPL
uniref:Ig-like domain-containing protein n=1 Tax=Molossus molossus TaxID=27622 RepID=A0A7J8C8R5_MOLMO|nr:hypothetical protein HJG59_009901 [Molossus molossus]